MLHIDVIFSKKKTTIKSIKWLQIKHRQSEWPVRQWHPYFLQTRHSGPTGATESSWGPGNGPHHTHCLNLGVCNGNSKGQTHLSRPRVRVYVSPALDKTDVFARQLVKDHSHPTPWPWEPYSFPPPRFYLQASLLPTIPSCLAPPPPWL